VAVLRWPILPDRTHHPGLSITKSATSGSPREGLQVKGKVRKKVGRVREAVKAIAYESEPCQKER
jgi:hypothetical protein